MGQQIGAVNQRIGDLKELIEQKFKHVHELISEHKDLLWKTIVWGGGAIITLWVGGILGLWTGLYYVSKDVTAIDKKLGIIEKQIEGVTAAVKESSNSVSQSARNVNDAVSRIPAAIAEAIKSLPGANAEPPGTLNILVFNSSQDAAIREALPRVAKEVIPTADKLGLGELVQDPALLRALLPSPDLAVAPQLAGTRFLVGTNNVVIVRPADNRVVAVVMYRANRP